MLTSKGILPPISYGGISEEFPEKKLFVSLGREDPVNIIGIISPGAGTADTEDKFGRNDPRKSY